MDSQPAGENTIQREPGVRKHTLRDAAAIGFGLTLAVLVVGGGTGYLNARRLAENDRLVAHTHEVIEGLEVTLSSLKDAETGQRGYLLAGDETYLQPYDDALERVTGELARLKQLTSDNPEQQTRLAALEQKVAVRLDELHRTVALMKGGDRPAALKIVHSNTGKALMDDVRQAVAGMQQTERDLLRQRAAESEASYYTTVLSILLTGIIGVVLVSGVFYLVMQRRRAAAVLAEHRERLRVTLASIGDAVLTTDAEGRISFLNGVAESLTGWTQAEAVGKPIEAVLRIINAHTRQTVENPVKRVLAEGKIVGLANHAVLIAKDGTERPIDDSAAPIRDTEGRMLGVVLVFRDISERKNADDALRASEARKASILRTSLDAILTIDTDGKVLEMNPATENMFGYAADELVGQNLKMLMPEPYHNEHDGYIANYLHTGQAKIIGIGREVVGRRKDGSTFPMELAVITYEVDKRRFFTGFVRDISREKENEKRVYGLLTELREADRRKDEFLATLAHELRNPLAPLRNMLEIMKHADGNGNLPRQARETMERQVRHLVRLVDDLLDMSRINRNKLELRKERVELASVINAALEMCRPLMEGAKHELIVTLPPEPIYLDADPVRLSQVFSNLLNNSCKYTEPGGHITVTAERHGGGVVVKVKDNGIGIPPDMLGRVFDMFTQVDRSLERSQDGLGIGLTLVKRLAEMHHGLVEAFSEGPGRGSEFKVLLPVLSGSEPAKSAVPTADPRMTTARRILVVDDNRASAESLVALLELTGNETHIAYDGLQAVGAAERFRPDVALLDVGLPKLNGLDVARRIREQPWGKDMILVALTGWGQDDDRHRSKAAGFDHHMVKPVDLGLLMKLLAETRVNRHSALRDRFLDGGKLDS
jgi:PAS domain S-box-containing protein